MIKKLLTLLAFCAIAVGANAAVELNKATPADLDGIKGIGPGMSTRILDERKKGSFKDWSDFIARVRGVGESNAAKFSGEGLTVNGAAFKSTAVAPARKDEPKQEPRKEAKPAAAKQ